MNMECESMPIDEQIELGLRCGPGSLPYIMVQEFIEDPERAVASAYHLAFSADDGAGNEDVARLLKRIDDAVEADDQGMSDSGIGVDGKVPVYEAIKRDGCSACLPSDHEGKHFEGIFGEDGSPDSGAYWEQNEAGVRGEARDLPEPYIATSPCGATFEFSAKMVTMTQPCRHDQTSGNHPAEHGEPPAA
jgi:hypothetical protein